MAERLAVLVLLVAGVLAGCGTAPGAHRSSGSPDASHSPPAAPRVVAPPVVATSPTPTTTAAPIPKPKPRPNACAGNVDSQLVLVSVAKQHVWMCAGNHLVYSAPVTTGAVELPYDSTPTGTYQIQEKDTDRTLTLLSGAQYQVNYWIPFDAPLFGFHDASWQSFPYGSAKYRTEGSHGCIHTPLAAMKFLYDWADVGATVTIRP